MEVIQEIEVNEFISQQKKKIKFIPDSDTVRYVTPVEYAELTGKHLMTIHKWLRQGRIDGAYQLGGRWKIPVKNFYK